VIDGLADRLTAWWFAPVPWRRLWVLSRITHLVVLFTVFHTDRWAAGHATAPRSFYQPILVARLVHLPAPTPTTMLALELVVVIAAGLALWGRGGRGPNVAVATAYTLWLTWAFSFSKVDHDRLTVVVALWVLACVPGRRVDGDELSGWAIRTIQAVFLVAYPLSALAKIRKSGWAWASGATFSRAIIRRGTSVGDLLVSHRALLVIGQWAFIGFEVVALSALWLRGRMRGVVLWGIFALHLFTWMAIGIHFLPHSIFLLSFLPLETMFPQGRSLSRPAASTRRSAPAVVPGDG
jgi:hypothetical protein